MNIISRYDMVDQPQGKNPRASRSLSGGGGFILKISVVGIEEPYGIASWCRFWAQSTI